MLEIKDITKTYKTGGVEVHALLGVSFTVSDGEFVAVMGPSGSGKSTLMHILGCLDTPTIGSYKLDGKDTTTLDDNALARIRKEKIGFVFQQFNLLPRATVLRNVMLPLVYAAVGQEERTAKAAAALLAVGFAQSHFHHRSNELSGGQIQRVAIARALVNNPSLILADEPTGNLDTKTGEVVLATFERLNREGRTIILITHEQTIAAHAKRVIHLKDGAIVSDRVHLA